MCLVSRAAVPMVLERVFKLVADATSSEWGWLVGVVTVVTLIEGKREMELEYTARVMCVCVGSM